jgi:3-phenylpropionate/trans-cinnamate dioxygenase ferredoxin reductase subunit
VASSILERAHELPAIVTSSTAIPQHGELHEAVSRVVRSGSMNHRADVVIVGAGQGGAQAAIFLRQQKFAGSVLVIGAEEYLPYERPALSKEYLAGDKAFDSLLLRPASYWEDKKVEVRLGQRVVTVDAGAHELRLSDGTAIGYGALVWAAGGTARRLPLEGHDLVGVHSVRDRADVDRMKSELETANEIVIIGGGYVGLEAAAVLRKLDKHVTVLEAEPRVLSRVAGEVLSRFFEAEHRAHGVDVRTNAKVVSLEENEGRVSGVRLASGESLRADLVIVGVGMDAAVEPLVLAGAVSDNGVVVDLRCKTSLPDVYAVGDCAAHPNVHANGRVVRLESIQNANDQALVVAKSIAGTLGAEERYDAVPWFWSNQYDLRLQTVGLSQSHDDVVVRGAPESRSFAVVYLRDGRVIALDCVNHTKDYVQGKALVAKGCIVDREKLARPEVTLKELVV